MCVFFLVFLFFCQHKERQITNSLRPTIAEMERVQRAYSKTPKMYLFVVQIIFLPYYYTNMDKCNLSAPLSLGPGCGTTSPVTLGLLIDVSNSHLSPLVRNL